MKTKIVVLVLSLAAAPLRLPAEDVTDRWGVGVSAGAVVPLAPKTLRKNSDPGAALGGALQRGLAKNWAWQVSYENLDLKNSPLRVEPLILSIVHRCLPDKKLSPIETLGAGLSFQRNLRPSKKNDVSLGLKAGFGLEYFIRRDLSLAGLVNYHYAAKHGDDSRESHIFSPTLALTYFFGPCHGAHCMKKSETVSSTLKTAESMKSVSLDVDGDGVTDGSDNCPATPKGAAVDSYGCPLDADKDGISDGLDRCADTPAGRPVDDNGCLLADKVSVELKVQFDTGKSTVKPDFMDDVKKLAEFMKKYTQVTAEIQGHSDNVGSEKLNIALSQKRAENVRDVLVSDYGVESSRLSAKGFGPLRPAADNATPEGRAKNRRVIADITTQLK